MIKGKYATRNVFTAHSSSATRLCHLRAQRYQCSSSRLNLPAGLTREPSGCARGTGRSIRRRMRSVKRWRICKWTCRNRRSKILSESRRVDRPLESVSISEFRCLSAQSIPKTWARGRKIPPPAPSFYSAALGTRIREPLFLMGLSSLLWM